MTGMLILKNFTLNDIQRIELVLTHLSSSRLTEMWLLSLSGGFKLQMTHENSDIWR